MKITMPCQFALPYWTGGGPRINKWAICAEMVRRGHDVQLIYTYGSGSTPEYEQTIVDKLISMGVKVVAFPSELQIHPLQMPHIITAHDPDIIFGFTPNNIAWASAYRADIPRVCFVGDLDHTVDIYRRQLNNRPSLLAYNDISQIHQNGIITKTVFTSILVQCSYVFCPVSLTCDWLTNYGIPTEYIPMPIVDDMPVDGMELLKHRSPNLKPKIVMAGHLGGIATLSSLYYLVDEVLPNMPNYRDYDWNICGGDKLRPDLINRFRHYPEIKFRGFVDDIVGEIMDADVFLCTTTITNGVRTRVAVGWSLGSCMVAHSANAIGQPECEDGVNILIADSGEDIAKSIDYITTHPEAAYDMRLAARKTYEDKFKTELSAGRMIDVMEQIVQSQQDVLISNMRIVD